MLKQYKILVNEGKGSDNALITVPAGAGARGNPTRITAKPDTRYELQDELKGKGLGPDQVRGKRVGKNLYLMFEDNGKPDIIIEGYYDPVNLQQVPTIVGKAENGSIYEYIPHDPELSSMSTTLKDGTTPAMLSLGGGPIAGGAFELAGLPLAAAAVAGGGLGGLGLAAAGLGAAALGGGGGGGGSSGAGSGGGGGGTAVAPNGGVAPTITIATDKNNDGVVSKAELDNASTFTVTAGFDKTKVAVGDKVVFTDGSSPAVVKTVVLTQAMIDASAVTVQFDKPVEGATLTVSALIQRDATNSASASDSAKLDTTSAPTGLITGVEITTDTNNDTYVNKNEIGSATTFDVKATFTKGNLAAGDKVVFNAVETLGSNSSTKTPIVVVLTATDINNGYVTTNAEKFSKSAEGAKFTVTATLENAAGNSQAASTVLSDFATLDATSPLITGVSAALDPASDGGLVNNQGVVGVQLLKVTEPTEAGSYIESIRLKNETTNSYTNVLKSNGKWDTANLAVGKYTPETTITDAAKNTSIINGTSFIVTDIELVPEQNTVSEKGSTAAGLSVLSNDSDSYKKLVNESSDGLLTVVSVQNSSNLSKTIASGGFVLLQGKYGELKIFSSGAYEYQADAANQTQAVDDVFTYTVKGVEGTVKSTTLTITVNGVNDAATSGATDSNGANINIFMNLLGAAVTTVPQIAGSKLNISDPDTDESFFKNLSTNTLITSTDVGGQKFFGGYGGTFQVTLDATGNNYSHNYSWGYAYSKSVVGSGSIIHDLLTLTSVDGTTSQTLHTVIGPTSASQHDYYSATATGLKVSGHDNVVIDTLFLKSDSLVLDLTANQIKGMDRIDITGSVTSGTNPLFNTIKIDLASLTSMGGNQQALFIIGDTGDKVQLVGTGWSLDSTGPAGYKSYSNVGNAAYKLYLETDLLVA